jgi:hypothetical protein
MGEWFKPSVLKTAGTPNLPHFFDGRGVTYDDGVLLIITVWL